MVRSAKMPNAQFRRKDFENLVADLLVSEGFSILKRNMRVSTYEIDLLAKNLETNEEWLVEAAFNPYPVSGSARLQLKQNLSRLSSVSHLFENTHALIVTSFEVEPSYVQDFVNQSGTTIWDLSKIQEAAKHHQDFRISHQSDLQVLQLIQNKPNTSLQKAIQFQSLASRLKQVPYGRPGWRDYEDVCIDILSYVFNPPFIVPPRIQTLTDDGLHRRDAVFRIEVGNPRWDRIVGLFRTRVIVAEFKNLSDPPSQNAVDAVDRYLHTNAMRTMALLCTRKPPDDNALRARASKFRSSQKLVIFLSDEDLISLLEIKASKGDPTAIIDEKIDDFLTGLEV